MLATLDPHSTYSDPEETKELTTPLDGNFSGIGIQFNMLNDTLYVIQTTAGGPSEKVGILPGDRLIMANDSVLSGVKRPNSAIIKLLRGPKGTPVRLKVLRKGVKQPLDFLVIRDDIPVYSVDAAYMADPTTGYIRLSRFAESTPREIWEAMQKLEQQGMKNLVLDLQDNGGGLLGAANDVASTWWSTPNRRRWATSIMAPSATAISATAAWWFSSTNTPLRHRKSPQARFRTTTAA